MSDPAIRAALARAVNGYDAARIVSFGGCMERDGMSSANKAHIQPMLAAAIAAFLRALPDQYARGGAAFWDACPPTEETRLWLAAAVEAAAQEPGHD